MSKRAKVNAVKPCARVDVAAGHCSYGQMIELGRVLDDAAARGDADHALTDIATIKALFKVLHPDAAPTIDLETVRYAMHIADGVYFWRKQESDKLRYKPTADEKLAGYEALGAVTGPTGVASTIAEKFGVHGGPDEVFSWPYATVFAVLLIDFERFKYQQRLSKIRDDRRRREDKNRRLSKR